MEENTKEVKMDVIKGKGATNQAGPSNNGTKAAPEKMSYEQLENIAHQLSEQCRDLYGKWQESQKANKEMQQALSAINRADYLFKVVQFDYAFNPEFVNKCVAELEEFLTIPENKDVPDMEVPTEELKETNTKEK